MSARCTNCGNPMTERATMSGGDAKHHYVVLWECPVCGEMWLDRNATPPRYEWTVGADERGLPRLDVKEIGE